MARVSDQFITCPRCGAEIPLTEALTKKIEENLKKEWEKEFRKREAEVERRMREAREAWQAVEAERRKMRERLEEELEKERARLKRSLEERVRRKVSAELEEVKRALEEERKEKDELKKRELKLLREKEKLEKREQELELEVARKIDEERKKIRQEVARSLEEKQRLVLREKDTLIEGLKAQIEELRRRAEQGSQQVQGEVLELEIEAVLRENFPDDDVEAVSTGKRGADIIHRVRDASGKVCGTIVWESKNTKHWQKAWIDKVKDDARKSKGDVAVIVSLALPEGVTHFAHLDGVWVSSFGSFLPLAHALRTHLLELARVKVSLEGVDSKKDLLYRYLSGKEFRQKVESMVEAIVELKQDLDRERVAFERMFSKREKQIYRLARSMAGMYGDVQGIVGKTLPDLRILELPEGES